MNEEDEVLQGFFNLALVTLSDNPKFILQVHLTAPVMEEIIQTRRLPVPTQATYHARLRSFFTPASYDAFMQACQLPAADKEGIFLECRIFPSDSSKMLILSKPDRFVLYSDWKSVIDKLDARENAVVSMWHCPPRDHQVGDEQFFLFRVDGYVLEDEPLPRIPDEYHLLVERN